MLNILGIFCWVNNETVNVWMDLWTIYIDFFYACFFKAVFIHLFTFSLLKASGLLYS